VFVVVVYFLIDLDRQLLDTPSYWGYVLVAGCKVTIWFPRKVRSYLFVWWL